MRIGLSLRHSSEPTIGRSLCSVSHAPPPKLSISLSFADITRHSHLKPRNRASTLSEEKCKSSPLVQEELN